MTYPSTHLETRHGLHRFERGLHFLYLEGTWEEMAEAHGKLLYPQIRRGLVPFFEGFIERHMAHGVLGSQSPRLRRLAAQFIETLIANPIEAAMPADYRKAVQSLGKVCGYSEAEVARVLSVPDAAAILGALLGETRSKTLQNLVIGVPACSAVVLGAPHTKNGHLLHGRNLDYDCLGTWDTHRVVSFNKPKGLLGHVSFTTAGAFTSGLTGMNEAGIFLGCNVSSTWDVKPGGIPFHALHTRILSEASNLKEALDIVNQQPRASGFNLHMSHGETGEACVVEYSSHHHHTRWLHEGQLVQTNHYQTPEMEKRQLSGPPHCKDNSHTRMERLSSLVSDLENATPSDMATLLKDRFDPAEGQHRAVGHIVACPLNVQAVVADVTEKKAWVSSGEAPAMDTDFVGFDLIAHLNDSASSFEVLKGVPQDVLDEDTRASIECYKKGWMSYIHQNNVPEAAALLEEAALMAPQESSYPLIAAMLRLRAADAKATQRNALLALPKQRRTFHKALAMTVLGYGHDMAGERQAACGWYRKALNTVEDQSQPLVEELQKRLHKPFRAEDTLTLRIDFVEPNLAGL